MICSNNCIYLFLLIYCGLLVMVFKIIFVILDICFKERFGFYFFCLGFVVIMCRYFFIVIVRMYLDFVGLIFVINLIWFVLYKSINFIIFGNRFGVFSFEVCNVFVVFFMIFWNIIFFVINLG